MKVINIRHPHRYIKTDFLPMVLALGYFDGVHVGHQQVIQSAINQAKGMGISSAVMTFDPHPSVVLRKHIRNIRLLTPLEEKIELLAKTGIDYTFVVHFTEEFAALTPQEFVDQYIIDLNVSHVVAGFDYSYGHMGKGSMETLPFHARGKFGQTTVGQYNIQEEKVSSTKIRESLLSGDLKMANILLGRYFTTKGLVIHGEGRGRKLGFPTANITPNPDSFLPAVGVYAVKMSVRDKWYNGVCNLGYKPTFHQTLGEIPTMEVHLFDCTSDLYGEKIEIEWHTRIRDEHKFLTQTDLINQIGMDRQNALECFDNE